ncbi:uncharacterized protein L201_003584 [Kwoniella dendrophila CBS 6074]|uniref:Pterin-binding domain-containing protein n=1 Tax=Kwoniella dendrophila CBS 6074 TaxID=1295534 RepID=A0AAX4JU04_9TREE
MTSIKDKIHTTLGPSSAPIRILLINPNSTKTFTEELVPVLEKTIPSDVRIDFITAPEPAPRSINNDEDGQLSTSVCEEYLHLNNPQGIELLKGYASIIVACFSQHPLVNSLTKIAKVARNQEVKAAIPVGILDAAIYHALTKGNKFGIATTGRQWEPIFDKAISTMMISNERYVGTKGTGFDAISLNGSEPTLALLEASTQLVESGADVIVLGCGGMSALREDLELSLKEKVGRTIPVVDGVQAALDRSINYARMEVAPTF